MISLQSRLEGQFSRIKDSVNFVVERGSKGLIALDGIHPNNNGHKAIADALRALGYGPLK